jgi:transposase InsO family protein
MDMVTGLPSTPRGHDAFWVFVCLTKLLHVAPCSKDISATATARLFFDHVYRLHGWPREVVSDRDPRFTSDFWQALTTLTGTKLNMSTANHPQTDGQAENSNKTVLAGLRHYCNTFQDDWDLHLTPIEFAYNDSVHSSTAASPFYLTYGHHPDTPAALAADAPAGRPPLVTDFLRHISTNLARARASLSKAQAAQTTAANRHRRDLTLPIGSFAWVSASHLSPPTAASARRKLGPKFFGPYRVLKALTPVTYHLALPPHLRHHPSIHVSALKPWTGTTDPASCRHPPPPDTIDGEEHFHVEAFLNSRGSGSRRRYLVKWTGYDADHNQWVSASSLRSDLDPATFASLQSALTARLHPSPLAAPRAAPSCAPCAAPSGAPVQACAAPSGAPAQAALATRRLRSAGPRPLGVKA